MSADIKTWQERLAPMLLKWPGEANETVTRQCMIEEIAELRAELARRSAVVSEGQAVGWCMHRGGTWELFNTRDEALKEIDQIKAYEESRSDGGDYEAQQPEQAFIRPAAPAPEAPTAAQAPEVAAGVELVARHIEKMRDDYHRVLGRQESDTGAWNYPPGGRDWMNMMDELVEEIRALAAQPKAAPVAEAPTDPDVPEAIRTEDFDVICDRRDLFDFLRAAWREGQTAAGEMDERERWNLATDHATKAIQGWATLQHVAQASPAKPDLAGLTDNLLWQIFHAMSNKGHEEGLRSARALLATITKEPDQ